MAGSVVSEMVIPKREGRAVEVRAGQVLRVTAVEGKQVADMALFNLHDPRESYSGPSTAASNGRSFRSARTLLSGPPFFNVMMTFVDDKHGVHWLIGGRCSPLTKRRDSEEAAPNCHTNIVNAVAPFGIDEYHVPLDTFVLFMYVDVNERCEYSYRAPLVESGDYVDLRAEMDLLVAVSACPSERIINDYAPKSLGMAVLEG